MTKFCIALLLLLLCFCTTAEDTNAVSVLKVPDSVFAACTDKFGNLDLTKFHDLTNDPDEYAPVGSSIHFAVITNGNRIVILDHNIATGVNWKEDAGPVPISLPYAYKDTESGIVLYVESDGRHVSAISPEGKLLWSRDPFADAHLEFYRTDKPRIVSIATQKIDGIKGSIAISFDSSQFGNLDITTGDFTFGGQNHVETLNLE